MAKQKIYNNSSLKLYSVSLAIFSLLILSLSIPPTMAGKSFTTYYELESGEQLDQGMYKRGNEKFIVVRNLQNNTFIAIDFNKEQQKLEKALYEREINLFEESKKTNRQFEVPVITETTKRASIEKIEQKNKAEKQHLFSKHYKEYMQELKQEQKRNFKQEKIEEKKQDKDKKDKKTK